MCGYASWLARQKHATRHNQAADYAAELRIGALHRLPRQLEQFCALCHRLQGHTAGSMLLALIAALPTAVTALQPLNGIAVKPLGGAASIDVGALLEKKAAVVFGTYAADFNAIEYGQRLRHYAPKLKERGVESLHLILNADEAASEKFVELLGLEGVCEVYCDPTGSAGRAFGCGRGWLPDEDTLFDTIPLNAYGKLFGMLLGLGAWATLPAVIGGYIGNPWKAQPWIADAMAQGSAQGRWPGTGLVLCGNQIYGAFEFLTTRQSQRSHRREMTYEELSGVPDTLVDFHRSCCGDRAWLRVRV